MIDLGSPRDVKISSDTEELLSQVKESIDELNKHRPFDEEVQERIKLAFLPDRVTGSLNMEGIIATRRQTLAIMDAMTVSENATKTEIEILNALRADEFVFENIINNNKLTEIFIREIHRLIEEDIGEAPGRYRPRDIKISQATFTPPDHLSVPIHMCALVEKYYKGHSDSAVVNAAWLHNRFTYIHPFLDGNGRTGRLLQDFALMEGGLLPTGIPSSKRDDYYDALSLADDGEWDQLIQMIAFRELEIIAKATAIAQERKQRTAWISALAKRAGQKKVSSQHKNFLVWQHKMNEIRELFEETARELSEASDVIFVRHQNFDPIEFSIWKEILEKGRAARTWFFSQTFFVDGAQLYRIMFYFRKHWNLTTDRFEPNQDIVSLALTGASKYDAFDFGKFKDSDIRLREIVFHHENMYAYYYKGGELKESDGIAELWEPEDDKSNADVVRDLYEDLLSKKFGI